MGGIGIAGIGDVGGSGDIAGVKAGIRSGRILDLVVAGVGGGVDVVVDLGVCGLDDGSVLGSF